MAKSFEFARQKPGKLGVRLPTWIGDVIQATSALRYLRRRFPEAEMTLIGKQNVRGLLSGAEWCNRFETSIPRGELDAIVLIPGSFRTAWDAWRAGIPVRAGMRSEWRGCLLTHGVPPVQGDRRSCPYSHMSYLRRLLEGLGIETDDMTLELPLDPASESGVDDLLRSEGLDPQRPLVALNPGSAWGTAKNWPEEYFAKTGDTLAETLGANVYILAGPGEKDEAHRIGEAMKASSVVFDHERADFPMTKSLIKRSTILISNDSGPRHIAACYDIPTIVMVGPFHPVVSNNGHVRTIMMYEGVDCSPCHLRTCPIDHRCMRRITPEKVCAVADKLLIK